MAQKGDSYRRQDPGRIDVHVTQGIRNLKLDTSIFIQLTVLFFRFEALQNQPGDSMRILFIVKEFPHSKVIGGPIIIYNRVKYLSEKHDVSLLAFAANPTSEEIESVSGYCLDMRLVPFPDGRSFARRVRDYLLGPVPPYFMQSYSEEMYESLRKMVRANNYDVVISEYSMVAQYLYKNPDLRGIKRIMSVHECYYLARKKVIKIQGLTSREGFRALLHLKGLKKFEFDMYEDADRVLTLTPEEKEELLQIRPSLKISVVPHGVDVEKFCPFKRKDGTPTIMFLGNFLHDPNREAFMFFTQKIWGMIKKECKDARFLAVGRSPTPDMIEVAREDPSIEITGQVDDVYPYFCESDVFVCPVRIGGGFRGKVLEAMASGVPVVSTELGAQGIPYKDGENMLIANSPEEIARGVVRLLTNRELHENISKNARKLVEQKFSWQKGVEILERVIEDVVAEDRAT